MPKTKKQGVSDLRSMRWLSIILIINGNFLFIAGIFRILENVWEGTALWGVGVSNVVAGFLIMYSAREAERSTIFGIGSLAYLIKLNKKIDKLDKKLDAIEKKI